MRVTWVRATRVRAIGVLLAVAFLPAAGRTQPADPLPSKELVIATKIAPPFVIKDADGSLHGISIELWHRIADRLHLRYRFSEQPTVPALMVGTAEESFDLAIAAVTVTAERDRMVDFTQPFYSTGLGIAVSMNESRWTSITRVLTSFGFIQAVLALVGIAMAVGVVVWLLERHKTAHFSGGTRGLGTGLWWSAIAMTQAGAAQNAPATLPGRIVAIGWMIASVVTIAVFTAGITSTLTRRELQGLVHGVNDLRSVRVGALLASATTGYLDRQRISYRGFTSPQDGLKALQAGRIDAFVYDKPLLTWLVLQDFSDTLRVLDTTFDTQNYAIALPKGSPLRQRLDAALLEEIESDSWQQTLFQYLGRK
ncbi:MAG TPA: transporter substrate-binding domain-containing protein [Xanthobacteraceae bacterium]|nr:transporter substrate-binding domain-containing protein [Xanthobacteraceae bacterium]